MPTTSARHEGAIALGCSQARVHEEEEDEYRLTVDGFERADEMSGRHFLGVDHSALRVALKRELDARRAVVCYARADITRVEPIVERLRADGVSTWRDDDDIVLCDDWREAIREAIGAGGPLLVFATQHLLGREVPKDEIALAETRNVRIIVVELDHGLDLSLLSLRLERLQTAKWFEDESKAYSKLLHALMPQGGRQAHRH